MLYNSGLESSLGVFRLRTSETHDVLLARISRYLEIKVDPLLRQSRPSMQSRRIGLSILLSIQPFSTSSHSLVTRPSSKFSSSITHTYALSSPDPIPIHSLIPPLPCSNHLIFRSTNLQPRTLDLFIGSPQKLLRKISLHRNEVILELSKESRRYTHRPPQAPRERL